MMSSSSKSVHSFIHLFTTGSDVSFSSLSLPFSLSLPLVCMYYDFFSAFFQLLSTVSFRLIIGGDTEAVDVVKDEKQMLCEESNNQAKQIVELGKKFAEEKENYVRNMYSLLVTARTQIAALKKENEKLKMR